MVKVIQARDINFDKVSFNGKVHLLRKIYETISNVKRVIFINNLTFFGQRDHLDRIRSLVNLGKLPGRILSKKTYIDRGAII